MSELNWRHLILPAEVTETVVANAEEMSSKTGYNFSALKILELLGHRFDIKKGLSLQELHDLDNALPHNTIVSVKAKELWEIEALKELEKVTTLNEHRGIADLVSTSGPARDKREVLLKKLTRKEVQTLCDGPDTYEAAVKAIHLSYWCKEMVPQVTAKAARCSLSFNFNQCLDFLRYLVTRMEEYLKEFEEVFSRLLAMCYLQPSLKEKREHMEMVEGALREREGRYQKRESLVPYYIRIEEAIASTYRELFQLITPLYAELKAILEKTPRSGPIGEELVKDVLEKMLEVMRLQDFKDSPFFEYSGYPKSEFEKDFGDRAAKRWEELAAKIVAETQTSDVQHFWQNVLPYLPSHGEALQSCFQKMIPLCDSVEEIRGLATKIRESSGNKELLRLVDERHETLAMGEVRKAQSLKQVEAALKLCPESWQSPAKQEVIRKLAVFYQLPVASALQVA